MGLDPVKHVVAVMMENRSFDNLLGWLYADAGNRPPHHLPPADPPTFDGLIAGRYANRLAAPGSPYLLASRPPFSWPGVAHPNQVPTPDPQEEFDHVSYQLFSTSAPRPNRAPGMSGFLQDYSTTNAGVPSAGQIMQSFGPAEASVINDLARNFAVSDAWFASVPGQAWPNRGFVHTGSSDGHLNNDDYEPYDLRTIFNALEDQGHSWAVFHDTTIVPSLTRIQFVKLWLRTDHFLTFADFTQKCAAPAAASADRKLPQYSFVEPRFTPEPAGLDRVDYPSDYHPPHNIGRGEQFLARTYQAVRASPYRDDILLVILFDEHGGCYDHVPPPWGAIAPAPGAIPTTKVIDTSFRFNRYGVRVPAIVVSSYVAPGTVFRANDGEQPYDHTSLLATLRAWLRLDPDPARFLPSPRVANAPTLDRVLTLAPGQTLNAWPDLQARCVIGDDDTDDGILLNDVQKSLLAHAVREKSATPHQRTGLAGGIAGVKTYAHALTLLRGL